MKKLLLALLLLPLFGLCQTTVTVGDAATDALLLGGQNSAFHLGRTNHTGTQLGTTISDFEATVAGGSSVTSNTTHRSSDGSDHTFLDQSIISGSTPTFTGTNFSSIPNGALSTDPLARANHTGTQTLSTISDASTLTLLGGRAGGQTLIGGTGASENLTLQSTASATLGKILFGNSAHDDVNNTLNIGTTSNLTFPLGVQGTGATGATISFGVQNSSAAALFHTFDDGAIALGWAGASQPYRLFVRNPTFGSGIFVSQTLASGSSIGVNVSVTGAATTNTGINTSATGATTNFSAQFGSGDVYGSIGSSSWAIGVVAPTAATKLCIAVNTGSVHTLIAEFRTSNDEATNTALKGTCTGAGTVNTSAEFSATGGTTNYGLLVTNGLTGIGTSTPDNTLDVDGFIEYDNKPITLGVAATTFAVTANGMTVTGDGGANTLATITGVTNGGFLTLIFVDGLVTITDDNTHAADSIDLSAAFTGADDTTLRLEHDGVSWYEVSRSVN